MVTRKVPLNKGHPKILRKEVNKEIEGIFFKHDNMFVFERGLNWNPTEFQFESIKVWIVVKNEFEIELNLNWIELAMILLKVALN